MEEIANIKAVILAGTSMVLFLAASVVYYVSIQRRRFLLQQNHLQRLEHEKEQEILKAIIRAQEQERNRISRNLHDSVGVYLSMLQLNLSEFIFLKKEGRSDPKKLESDIINLDRTVDTVRSICRDLYPVTLTKYGLLATIEELLARLNNPEVLVCEANIAMQESQLPQDAEQKLNLLRVIQEVINNILKYAACRNLLVSFEIIDQCITIRFSHDGKAFTDRDAELEVKKNSGIGLQSIYNRLLLLNGEIHYEANEKSTNVKISIPV